MTTAFPAGLAAVLARASRGAFPPADGSVTFLPQPSDRDAGVIAFTAHTVVFADADHADHAALAALLPADDLGAPLCPPFLTALAARTRRHVNGVDLLTVAEPLPGPPPLDLRETPDRAHPRIARAVRHRDEVRAWTVAGGTLVIGRGVAGRWEAALEVEPGARGNGLGRALARSARHLVPGGAPLWAQAAPGNAASVRALLSAGFAPVGAEALLVRPDSG